MKKFWLPVLILAILCTITFMHVFNNYRHLKSDYQKEIVLLCPSQKDIEKNPKLLEQAGCTSANLDLYSKEDITRALDFAKKVKYACRNQDFDYFASILSYPLDINQNSITTSIKSKEELLLYDKSTILNQSRFEEIDHNRLFNNYAGFMLGNGFIWFWSENGISNIVINL